jgi:diguanylate cyclase (GGDEF)-like protein
MAAAPIGSICADVAYVERQLDARDLAETSARVRSIRAVSAPAEPPCRDSAASERELAAALRQIDALKERNSLLGRTVALLARLAAKASQFAYRDELTDLPNRRLLLDRFAQAAKRANRQRNQVAVLFLDLDGFKQINDALGHTAGDELLQQVAARLTACIRTSDTACRYGGDEFVVLLPEFKGHESVYVAAEKIRAELAMPYVIGGAAIELTASAGTAVYPVDGYELGDLIQTSDRAMYRSKARSPASPSVLDCGPARARPAAISAHR